MQIHHHYQKLSRQLSPAVKRKVRLAIPHYMQHAQHLKDPHALHKAALSTLKGHFPTATVGQSNQLAFYLIGSISASDDGLKGKLDSMNEMSEVDSLRMQMAMDRRSKFVDALSNIMRLIDSTQETIVQNLKG
ncbi:MAG: hypothetical protein ABI765_03200 [Gemmatimonadota bacterium]